MQQKHTLVTGASSGIGAAIVTRLLASGYHVHGVARRETAFEGNYSAYVADLECYEARAGLLKQLPPINAFVHAAGFMATGNLGELTLNTMWALHVEAAEHLANALAPAMQRGDKLLFIGSRTATGAAGRSQYAATKAALVAMARSYAIELAPRGITANVVAPAATLTPMLQDPLRKGVAPKLPPLGRFIEPSEVAACVNFLLSNEANMITGQTLMICGGSSL
jgi:NAD(P)-dependent dehydrogenase (short-subunit alcohol dehydrogenase family)